MMIQSPIGVSQKPLSMNSSTILQYPTNLHFPLHQRASSRSLHEDWKQYKPLLIRAGNELYDASPNYTPVLPPSTRRLILQREAGIPVWSCGGATWNLGPVSWFLRWVWVIPPSHLSIVRGLYGKGHYLYTDPIFVSSCSSFLSLR